MSATDPAAVTHGELAPAREHWWPLANRPLLALCLCFLLGIWAADCRPLGAWWLVVLVVAGMAAIGLSRAAPVALSVGAFAAGALLHALQTLPRPDDVGRLLGEPRRVAVEGFALAELPTADRTRRFVVAARRLETWQGSRAASGNVLVRVPDCEGAFEGVPVRCEGLLSRPRSSRNPGAVDYATLLARRHIGAVLRGSSIQPLPGAAPPWSMRVRRAAAAMRRSVVEHLRAAMPGPSREFYTALVSGIVYGMQVTPVPAATAECFRRTGTIHLLVVSGAQVSWLAAAVLWVPRMRWRGARGVQALLLAIPLGLLALMVGLGPSVTRAIAMCVISVLSGVGGLRRHDYDPYTSLGVAAAVICAFDSQALFSIGAQLSFAATLGLVLATSLLPRRPPGWPGRLVGAARTLAAAALGVWVMTTPLLAWRFSAFPLVGSVANLIAVPLAAGVMACACLAMPLAYVWLPLAVAPAWAARWLVEAMLQVNAACASLPLAYLSVSSFPGWGCGAWYGVIALVGLAWRRGRWWEELTPKRGLAAVAVALLAAAVWFAASAYRQPAMTVTFLDVGHGQCCVVRSPSGKAMMIDAGTDPNHGSGEQCARDVILPFLATQGIHRLDAVVITHPDADHCNALPSVLEQVPAGLILESYAAVESDTYDRLCAAARRRGIARQRTWAGGRIDLGGGVQAEVLWPTGTPADDAFSRNDRCLVLKLRYGATGVLLPADTEEPAQAELLRRGADVSAQVLQVPHHGGRKALNPEFLSAVNPEWAVVSCRAGDPAHPDPLALAKLREDGAAVARTDLEGAVTVRSDGRRVTVRTHARNGVAQKRSPAWAQAWARASSKASGSRPPTAASAGSFSRRAASSWSARLRRTSGASSNLRVRKRRIVPSSSAETARAAGRTRGRRSSGGPPEASSVGAATASGNSVCCSFTTTVPAARSPNRFDCGWMKATSPPTKYKYGRKSIARSALRMRISVRLAGVPSSWITRRPAIRFPGV